MTPHGLVIFLQSNGIYVVTDLAQRCVFLHSKATYLEAFDSNIT